MRSAEHDARPLASHMVIVWDMRLMMMMQAGKSGCGGFEVIFLGLSERVCMSVGDLFSSSHL